VSRNVHPYLLGDGPVPIAHRGGALEGPENTIEAFENAVELGYRHLETDAQLSADGVVVAFHDPRIDRVSNEVGAISEWRWADLQELPINGSGRLSSIANLLQRFPDAQFNLDAKSDEVAMPLLAVIAEADAFDRVCVGSFSDARLTRMRSQAAGDLCTSFGPRAILRQAIRSQGLPVPIPPGNVIQAPPTFRGLPLITDRFVNKAHDDGLFVHAWTIDEPAEMHRLLDLGVDGIMTDRPSVLKGVFEERGLLF